MGTPAPDDMPAGAKCPSCGMEMKSDAVLCIACGYHLKLGRHLATVVDRDPARPSKLVVDENPYASPVAEEPQTVSDLRDPFKTDLTENGARQAKAIVGDANMLVLAVLIALTCPMVAFWVWFLMCPWYAYRLWQWRQLDAKFAELHQPNSFSPHGELAGAFQDCQARLRAGIAIGVFFWAVLVVGGIIALFAQR